MRNRTGALATIILALSVPAAAQGSPAAAGAPAAQGAPAATRDVMAVAAEWKASVAYDPLTGDGHILRGADLVRFKRDYPVFSAGPGIAVRAPAIRDSGARLEIRSETVAALERWFAERDAERASRFSIAAILIDPGHGGKDSGAIGEFGSGKDRLRVLEKDVVLAIC